jgi:hypothetical protein
MKMLFAFQILLFALIVLYGLSVIGEVDKENKNKYLSVLLASVAALCVSFYVG